MTPRTLASVLLLTTTAALAGIDFTTQTSDASGPVATTRGLVDGDKAKIEFVSGRSGPGMQAGNYMLSQDGGKTLYMVNPKEESYMKLDLDKIASQVGMFMDAAKGFVSMTFSDPKVETLLDEKGPSMHGYATRHVKMRTAYTMSSSFFGRKDTTSVSRDDEMWVTKELKDAGMQIWAKQRSIRTGNADIDKVIAAETGKVSGIPLKTISVTTTRKGNGADDVVTATNAVTSLKTARVPAATFELPANYKDATAELAAEMKKAGEELDKEVNEEADPSAAKPGSPQDSVRKLMKGLFGGRK